ncbi:hypothetical protein BCV70DRAFT_224530 [Testicularia cyperi]|uniref:snRNA-activating protein complex subunit 3 n=1 Tax=Testicularia cyperi TaxID=1882483 RepID=A0A317Y035_9BASI|nr:hypothetical protein BCV70DRAFT_224530 [Testicularia cyperi]
MAHLASGMHRAQERRAASQAYASEPVPLSSLRLDRRPEELKSLVDLWQQCRNDQEGPDVESSLARINGAIRGRVLDENFSVAVRERWQSWSRLSRPFRNELASNATAELRKDSHNPSLTLDAYAEASAHASDSDASEEDGANDDPEDNARPTKRRKTPARARAESSSLESMQESNHIRAEREALLQDMDRLLPSAFHFSERQLMVYVQRQKPKLLNNLERPFTPAQIRTALQLSHAPREASKSQKAHSTTARDHRCVLTISFFSSAVEPEAGDADPVTTTHEHGSTAAGDPFPSSRSAIAQSQSSVKRVAGEGPGGLRRSQTIEVLSDQPLDVLRQSLLCWSDEQPERLNWQSRLAKQVRKRQRRSSGTTGRSEQNALDFGIDDLIDIEDHNPLLSRFTGQRRQTDAVALIEGKLYGYGLRHGENMWEQDLATQIVDWIAESGNTDSALREVSIGGDMRMSFDELPPLRVGQPYWLLHQGDCVHCFMIEQIRQLRPAEAEFLAAAQSRVNVDAKSNTEPGSVDTADPSGSDLSDLDALPFPRVTWLSNRAMLRFNAARTDNYSIGHRILASEGYSPFIYKSTAAPTLIGTERMQLSAFVAERSRNQRLHESLLRTRQGKCFACNSRKAQIGILGGSNVRLPPQPSETATSAPTLPLRSKSPTGSNIAVEGIDEHLTTLCLACAVLLGVPVLQENQQQHQLTPDMPNRHSHDSIRIDWDTINRNKQVGDGWTIFPIY